MAYRALLITADLCGDGSGGGSVVQHEFNALRRVDPDAQCFDRSFLGDVASGPFDLDAGMAARLGPALSTLPPDLVHFYGGSFPETVKLCKQLGARVTYTAAAHDLEESRREHVALLGSYPFETGQGEGLVRHLAGYLAADALVCPSRLSESAMRGFGYQGPIHVIPHGVTIPQDVPPYPKRFGIGYMGQYGPDKGVVYLLRAWKRLALPDACLFLAGSQSPEYLGVIRTEGGGNVVVLGYVRTLAEFYRRVTVYIQPSITEGFGMEVLEAMAHARPVLCSAGAGACEVAGARGGSGFQPRDVDALASLIRLWSCSAEHEVRRTGRIARNNLSDLVWPSIEARYVALWRSLLAGAS